MRNRYPHAWSGRHEDRNALSSLELAKRHVGKQLCHQTCETDLLLWMFITNVRSCQRARKTNRAPNRKVMGSIPRKLRKYWMHCECNISIFSLADCFMDYSLDFKANYRRQINYVSKMKWVYKLHRLNTNALIRQEKLIIQQVLVNDSMF